MKQFVFLLMFLLTAELLLAQQADSVTVSTDTVQQRKNRGRKDTATGPAPVHSPRKATIRSAIIPGWGQIYNKKYWKVPIVYGALGTCVGIFFFNRTEYIDARNAYRYKLDNDPSNDALIKPRFRPVDPEAIRRYRNDVRQNVDYSVLFFLICWGLNVVDATVDGHLKAFEVNENLSLHLKPAYLPQTRQSSLGFVVTFGSNRKHTAR
jgi:hypothetical protein